MSLRHLRQTHIRKVKVKVHLQQTHIGKVKVKVQRPTGLHAVGNHELEEKAREQSVDAYIARTVREDDEDDELGLAMAVSRDAAMLTEGSAGSSAAGAAASASASSSAEVELQLAEAPRPKGKGKARAL